MREILLVFVIHGLLLTQGCTSTPVSADRQSNPAVLSSAPANDELILQRATRLRLPY